MPASDTLITQKWGDTRVSEVKPDRTAMPKEVTTTEVASAAENFATYIIVFLPVFLCALLGAPSVFVGIILRINLARRNGVIVKECND